MKHLASDSKSNLPLLVACLPNHSLLLMKATNSSGTNCKMVPSKKYEKKNKFLPSGRGVGRPRTSTAKYERKQSVPKRIKKSCSGCGDTFTTYVQDNYDYCRKCEINNSRYAQNQCPECGDGSGIIKFLKQKPRQCKTCALTKSQISCFYGCDFIATVERIMEQHYQQKHSLKPKEVNHA
jgi:hypothetical protein